MNSNTFDYKKWRALQNTPVYWGGFDISNRQHRYILSLLHQLNWTRPGPGTSRQPDPERLGTWLRSEKSPVRLPLRKMNRQETSKIITALENIIKSKYQTNDTTH